MNACVVEHGSIGKRHSRLLDELGCKVSVVSRRDIAHANRYAGPFERLIEERREATVFPVREYWQDEGRKEDFERVNGEYEEVFDA